jgi:hypothetical protein
MERKGKNESFLLALFISESQLATNLWHQKYNKLFVSWVLTRERGRGISDFTTTRDLGNAAERGGVAAPDINFSLYVSTPCEENKNVSISPLGMIC